MISVTGLVKHHGALRVLNGVSFEVRKGETAALIGPSGSGKSTVLRCINGLERFDRGDVCAGGVRLKAGDNNGDEALRRLRQRVGFVFQQFHLFPHLRVLDNVAIGMLRVLRRPRAEAEETAKQLLQRVGLADKVHAWPDQLSGGQQQRVAIARALALKPEAILFDEPTSALDPRMTAEVLAVMSDLARSGQTMIVVSHAMRFVRKAAGMVHFMHEGRIAEAGPPGSFFADPQHPAAREFLAQLED